MALIECRNCHKLYNDTNLHCPQCGWSLSKEQDLLKQQEAIQSAAITLEQERADLRQKMETLQRDQDDLKKSQISLAQEKASIAAMQQKMDTLTRELNTLKNQSSASTKPGSYATSGASSYSTGSRPQGTYTAQNSYAAQGNQANRGTCQAQGTQANRGATAYQSPYASQSGVYSYQPGAGTVRQTGIQTAGSTPPRGPIPLNSSARPPLPYEAVVNGHTYRYVPVVKDKSTAVILCVTPFTGMLGFHKYYEGKVGLGLLYTFTCGLFVIGWLADVITYFSSFAASTGDKYYMYKKVRMN